MKSGKRELSLTKKMLLWILRKSDNWEGLAYRLLGRVRYDAIKAFAWRIYLRR